MMSVRPLPALGFCVAAAVLVDCGGSLQPSAPSEDTVTLADAHYQGSWMSSQAKRIKELLYVSGFSAVYVYNYRTGALVGKVGGFENAAGECVDKSGNVWVTDFINTVSGFPTGSVTEFARGESKPRKVLFTNGAAIGCSVDPTSGDLAVSNWLIANGTGNVVVFKSGSGSPKIYANDSCNEFAEPPGYDLHGNLYFEAYPAYTSGPANVCELPHGANALRSVRSNAYLYLVSSVMWDGKFITLATDLQYSVYDMQTVIYRMKEDASGNLTQVGRTVPADDCNGHGADQIWQPFIVGAANTPANVREGHTIVGSNRWCNGRFNFWQYPKAKDPKRSLSGAPGNVDGQSVSIAP